MARNNQETTTTTTLITTTIITTTTTITTAHIGLWHGAEVGGGVKDGRLVDVVDVHGEDVPFGVEKTVEDDAADKVLVCRLKVQQRLARRDRVQLQLARWRRKNSEVRWL